MKSFVDEIKEIGTLAGVTVEGKTISDAIASLKEGLTAKTQKTSKFEKPRKNTTETKFNTED